MKRHKQVTISPTHQWYIIMYFWVICRPSLCVCAVLLTRAIYPHTVVPVATSVSADETEALKAEITKAVEKVQEAGES